MRLAKRVNEISASPTLAMSAKAKELQAQGIPVISFGAGEPDFGTPDFIKQAAKKAIDDEFTKYTANAGIPELKKAICAKLLKDNGLEYAPNNIIVSSGAKQSLFNALFAICDEGDEVILISPYWVTYAEQIKMSQAVPVVIHTTDKTGFKATKEDLEKAITSKTKAIILNSPSNPTGAVYTKEELKALADVLLKHEIYIISDEIYEKILYSGEHVSIASFNPELKKRTILINGVSKSHSMTGWRIGYAAAEKDIVSAMDNIQSHTTSNASSISQKAALAAMLASDESIKEMVVQFNVRRDYIVNEFNSIEDVTCTNPEGAFYVFPNIKKYLGKKIDGIKIENTIQFCEQLLEKDQVAAVPGEAFGDNECIRLSYALGMDDIKEGMSRIKRFFGRFS